MTLWTLRGCMGLVNSHLMHPLYNYSLVPRTFFTRVQGGTAGKKGKREGTSCSRSRVASFPLPIVMA